MDRHTKRLSVSNEAAPLSLGKAILYGLAAGVIATVVIIGVLMVQDHVAAVRGPERVEVEPVE